VLANTVNAGIVGTGIAIIAIKGIVMHCAVGAIINRAWIAIVNINGNMRTYSVNAEVNIAKVTVIAVELCILTDAI